MKGAKILMRLFAPLFLTFFIISPAIWASEPYPLSFEEAEKHKAWLDDPAPFYESIDWFEEIVPPETYSKITYDVESMKRVWAESVGFKAPDVVGKTAPEIQPGKYALEDKGKYPFDTLMWKHMYDRFNPPGEGTPNHIGNFTEMEVVPTRQYYWALPLAEATLENKGKTKQDEGGYLIEDTYVSGYPYPQPSGEFKAQQILYNWQKRYIFGDKGYYIEHILGTNKRWRTDHNGLGVANQVRLHGRVLSEPYGWMDERAKREGEDWTFRYKVLAPRDMYGVILSQVRYTDPNKFDLFMLYVNVLRRIRRMSAADTQDPALGQDCIYEDAAGFSRKLTPKRWPYQYKMVGEQEFLVPMTIDGSPYIDSKNNYSYRNLTFERRPMYVIELNQLDPNYIYSRTVMHFDREVLLPVHIENYDQKGRLYRTWDNLHGFLPEMGLYNQFNGLLLDHIDVHSSWFYGYAYQALWLDRTDVSLGGLIRAK